jgi:hypothetical protein
MKKIILKVEHVNVHGEKMTLAMDKDYKLWFKHEDCNNKFENFKDLETKKRFKYILSKEEQIVLVGFLNLSTTFATFKLNQK